MLAAQRGSQLRPAYSAGSRERHVRSGACDLTGQLTVPGLRRDVDTVEDLVVAVALGPGPATSDVLRAWRPAHRPAHRPAFESPSSDPQHADGTGWWDAPCLDERSVLAMYRSISDRRGGSR